MVESYHSEIFGIVNVRRILAELGRFTRVEAAPS